MTSWRRTVDGSRLRQSGESADPVEELRKMMSDDVVHSASFKAQANDIVGDLLSQLPPKYRRALAPDDERFARLVTQLSEEGAEEARPQESHLQVGRQQLADWARRLGIADPLAAPNHGWRYRLKSVGLEYHMKEVLLDVIQGHAPRTEGEKYINAPLKTFYPEILKHPRYEVLPGERRDRRRKRS